MRLLFVAAPVINMNYEVRHFVTKVNGIFFSHLDCNSEKISSLNIKSFEGIKENEIKIEDKVVFPGKFWWKWFV